MSNTWQNEAEYNSAVNSCLARVFLRMCFALLVTAATAFAVYSTDAMMQLIFNNMFIFFGLLIAQIALVIIISSRIERMSVGTANALFFLYSILMGATLSSIFILYDLGLIWHAFLISALMFSAMAAFGILTKRDLTSIGSYLIMGLIGVIIASVVNMFLRSEMLDFIISYVAVFVFLGLTAFNTQRTKKMLRIAHESSQQDAIARVSVLGALSLYLNFINLFMRVLAIMGRRR
jgi:FtsH-binding integral membrane protein